MVTQTFTLIGDNLEEPVCHFVRQYYQQAHESNYPGGFIRIYEDYSFLNDNDMVICFRVDFSSALQGKVIIEMMCGGSWSSSGLTVGSGSEVRRIKHFRERLDEFCKAHTINLL